MRKSGFLGLAGGIALVMALPAATFALNRFVINNQTLFVGTTGNVVPILADVDQDTYGFSVHLTYDAAKVNVTAVQQGSAITGLAPEWFDGTITPSPGRVVWGAVFDLSDPVTKKLSAGPGKEVLKLLVNVAAAAPTSDILNLNNQPGPPAKLNVMSDSNGDSVAPAPALVDGTLTLSTRAPDIQSYSGNSGSQGTVFSIVGSNFDQPGLAVTVCGKSAAATLLGDQRTLSVTAPACTPGQAEVKVCTNFGCDTDPAGFTYEAAAVPVIENIELNIGSAGKEFYVVGQRFNSAGFTIRVCGVTASFTLLEDQVTAAVISPACGTTGWAVLEACNDVGCDDEAMGFNYTSAGGTFIRGNANNDRAVDLSDAVFTLSYLFSGGPAPVCLDAADSNDLGRIDLSDPIFTLNFLFQGGPRIPAPYPDPGTDPTPGDPYEC